MKLKRTILFAITALIVCGAASPAQAFDWCFRRMMSDQVNVSITDDTGTSNTNVDDNSYSDMFAAISLAFSALQTEINDMINQQGHKISEFKGANVQLGSSFEFKLHGTGSATNLDIILPSINATMNFEKSVLWGLISASCTATINIPNPYVLATLNPASGALSNVDVHAKTSAHISCSDNIPLVGPLFALVLDHFAEKALQPTLNKINSPAGFPLGSKNFSGLNKLLQSQSFVANGGKQGTTLATKLEQLIDNNDVDLKIYNVPVIDQPTATCYNAAENTTAKTLLSFSVPTKGYSLNVTVKPVFSAYNYLNANASSSSSSSSSGTASNSSSGVSTKPTTGSNGFAVGTSVPTSPGSLTAQVASLQLKLETEFEFAPSIIELVYASPTSTQVVDLAEEEDSAIWTGVYLGSQCLREAATTNPTEQTDAEGQVQWTLSSIENLFLVTGTPGLIARFAFDTNDPKLKSLNLIKEATAKNGWIKSTALPGWMWTPSASRDQYTGIMFGLAICNQLTKDSDIRSRTSNLISSAVTALEKNGWAVPLSNDNATGATGDTIELFTQVAWLKLAALSSSTAAEKESWEAAYEQKLSSEMNNPITSLTDSANPTFINNYYEYYTWNLGFLRLYPLLEWEKNPTFLNYFQDTMTTKYWDVVANQGNAEFAFIKLGTMGFSGSQDEAGFTSAVTSLRELAFRNRRNFAVDNTKDPSLGRANVVTFFEELVAKLGLQQLASQHFNMVQSANPIPMSHRAPDVFLWEISPFQLTGGGSGNIEAPPVDVIFAYWMGRYHKLINDQY